MLSFGKDLIIETLRNEFAKDSYFHYSKDQWGFPNVVSQSGLPLTAGLHDDLNTRVFIGEAFHYGIAFYPSIIVKNGSFRTVPISISRNEDVLYYKAQQVIDGYGKVSVISTPNYIKLAGAFEGELVVDILAPDLQSRDELTDLVVAIIQIIGFHQLKNAGLFVKPNGASISGPSEMDDLSNNNKIYKQTVTFAVRSEWSQQIPVSNLLEIISFCVDFGQLLPSGDIGNIDPNIEVKGNIDLMDLINNL